MSDQREDLVAIVLFEAENGGLPFEQWREICVRKYGEADANQQFEPWRRKARGWLAAFDLVKTELLGGIVDRVGEALNAGDEGEEKGPARGPRELRQVEFLRDDGKPSLMRIAYFVRDGTVDLLKHDGDEGETIAAGEPGFEAETRSYSFRIVVGDTPYRVRIAEE